MKTTVALFLVLCLLAVQANPSGEEGTGAAAGAKEGPDFGNGGGAGTGADSGNNGQTGVGAGSGSDRGSGAGAVSGSDGGAGTGANSGNNGGTGAVAGSGSDRGSGAGAVSGSDGGAGTGDESGSNGGAGAGSSSGSGDGSDAGYFRRYYVRDRNHLKQLLSGIDDILVMIYFLSSHCRPCLAYIPQPYKLTEEFGNSLLILTVDIDVTKDVTTDYNIKEIPTFVFVKNFKKVAESTGRDYEALRRIIYRFK